MDEIAAMIVATTLLGLSSIGVFHLALDYRLFDTIETQCKDLGYIQNKTTRITCLVEGKKK